MNYYTLLPKKYNIPLIKPNYSTHIYDSYLLPYISHSVVMSLNDIYQQIEKMKIDMAIYNINYIFSLVNPYDFIYRNIHEQNVDENDNITEIYSDYKQHIHENNNDDDNVNCVSQLNSTSLLIYNLIEINNMLSQLYNYYSNINILCINDDSRSFYSYIKHTRNSYNDNIHYISSTQLSTSITNKDKSIYNIPIPNEYTKHNIKYNLLYFDLDYLNNIHSIDTQKQIKLLALYLRYILVYQEEGGRFILKLNNLYYKPFLDVVYILTSLYEKVYICKPHISSQEERFIVCEKYNNRISSIEKDDMINSIEQVIFCDDIVDNFQENHITSLLNNSLPKLLLNKLEEINIITAYQTLDKYDEMINICKSKNIFERIENYKKMSITKSTQWCQHNNIPYNQVMTK
jgi:hypothetical protein|tara:strand:- start:7141 stop:8346 length:1206 start_codon:yes stop_codon:yes gene_type:complete